MPLWVSVVVLAQVKEWSKIRDERVLDSHVGSSIKPSREQVQTLGNGVVEDTSVCLDVRVRLREKESGPRFWVKLDKVRSNEQLGA